MGSQGSLYFLHWLILYFQALYVLGLFIRLVVDVCHETVCALLPTGLGLDHFRAFYFLYILGVVSSERFRLLLEGCLNDVRIGRLSDFGLHSGHGHGVILLQNEGTVFFCLLKCKELFHLVHEHGVGHYIFHVAENFLNLVFIGCISVGHG